jgi:hypothetical protein
MKRSLIFLSIFFISMLFANGNNSGKDSHALFTEILKEYVHEGKVNYKDVCKDDRLEKYLNQLSATNPEEIENKQDKLAFWINAYNAFTIKIVCDYYPVESIRDIGFGGKVVAAVLNKTVWDKEFIEINGTKISLNHIEHEIIRKEFADPRIHFALVCAAVSCPPLRSEAFEGYKLDDQLNEQGDIFLNQKDKNYFSLKEKEAHLSKILDWYGKDFGADNEEILQYLTRFLPEETAAAIKENPKEWDVKYTDYNWSLNE